MPKAINIITNKEELEELYIHKNMSKKDLCSYFGVGKEKMRLILRQYGVYKPQSLSNKLAQETNLKNTGYSCFMESPNHKRSDINAELLKDLYINQNLSREEVAKRLKCGLTLVQVKLKEYNIKKASKLKNSLREQTNMKRYGVKFNSQTDSWKEHTRQTCLKKYGVPCTLHHPDTQKMVEKTMLQKYGVKKALESQYFQQKAHQTKKKNGSYGKSREEDLIYFKLKEKYTDIVRQYSKDPRYPFPCDFYIPSLDIFIEYQGHWTHGKHPFNENNPEDLEILNKWKEKAKNSRYYIGAIRKWTIIDPLKREYALRNNLKFKEIWRIKKGGQKR